jgi:hypothetical protein
VSSTADFSALPLHDALLDRIVIDWDARSCLLHLRAFLDTAGDAQPCIICFRETTGVTAPHQAPWGESVHVNRLWAEVGTFFIEMQSGDVIRIDAEAVELSRV